MIQDNHNVQARLKWRNHHDIALSLPCVPRLHAFSLKIITQPTWTTAVPFTLPLCNLFMLSLSF